jgi:nucleoside-diphosphate-sugar epimerase
MLRASVEAGVKRFIYVSSNSVAGTTGYVTKLMTEEDPPNPYLNYGISKLRAEYLVNEFWQDRKIDTVILRPCWFYGPHQPWRQTFFFKMIKKGNPLLIGRGQNLRSMSYTDNVVQALLLAAENPAAKGETYWIADETPYKTIDIYKTIAELLMVKEFKPRFLPDCISGLSELTDRFLQNMGFYIKEIHVAGEMNKNIACSIEKAKRQLGYSPGIGLREGVYRSIQWCHKNGIDI